eukprot:CAMPEP_0175452930 /NCGR_PEP_ID=MMETSP0095-20121207/63672_1 /TAXON_ID=311494 /ORGANISM="Alexandrium monilatum, Strain CCMP3105" /LENGTH=63 /DNA_ID=CAMNT_0016753515 /DNA_START=40 /DNA_END=227 /DNA_ORIENTATION=+
MRATAASRSWAFFPFIFFKALSFSRFLRILSRAANILLAASERSELCAWPSWSAGPAEAAVSA